MIENLIATYAELVDSGDFARLGALLADATFTGIGAPVSGAVAIEQMFRDMLIVYDDGTPHRRRIRQDVHQSDLDVLCAYGPVHAGDPPKWGPFDDGRMTRGAL